MRYIILLTILIVSFVFLITPEINYISIRQNTPACIFPYKSYTYKTCAPISYKIDEEILVIPSNYKTDLASIPRVFWSFILPMKSELMSAAILHDFLYEHPHGITRKDADDIFFNLLISNGVSKKEAVVIYLLVRAFGWRYFNGPREA